MILVNLWAIGRGVNYWEDPLEFKPERFLNSSLNFKGNDFEFIPFGSGRRICPGLTMASMHVSLIVASLVHFFDWSLPHGKDPKDLDMTEKFSEYRSYRDHQAYLKNRGKQEIVLKIRFLSSGPHIRMVK
ncbi:(S)-N-methylcoclaurine 3'-hydroxylase isozyme 1-like [Ziziphus jujuba]|uniref:(S)-N-methylcoclaurine 3'-hydroxylase isozyme 1-like n=1 Tax=Ziziphus jujuba TaxID=326968 RepID=A0ABM4AB16_ZIZJJ|nr:(S)-N-methylcoclaurine 3'-hydroxylase isozyme 1-like [Ziziphus jujuba]